MRQIISKQHAMRCSTVMWRRPAVFASVNGVRLHYEVEGTGLPLIVVSLAGTPIYQRTYSRRLRDRFQVVFLDGRGSGPSEAGDIAALTVDTVLADIEGVRQAIGVERVAVVGHSIHGFIALAYARQYPDSVWGAVVIGTPPEITAETRAAASAYWDTMASSERKALLAERLAELDEDGLAALPPDQAWIRRYVATGPERFCDPAFDWTWFWDDCSIDMDAFGRLAEQVRAAYDPADAFPAISCPVFLAIGVHDYPIPPPLWHPVKVLLADLTYHAFERSGHWPQFEEQESFDDKLIAWAERIS
jgi:proline iminopeptidase